MVGADDIAGRAEELDVADDLGAITGWVSITARSSAVSLPGL